MFKKTVHPSDDPLEEEIASVLQSLKGFDTESDEYAKCVKRLSELYSLKPQKTETDGVSKDTALIVAGNLVGIALIVLAEKSSVITSKAVGFVQKVR